MFLSTFSSYAQDYTISIGEEVLDIELEREYSININGEEVKFNVRTKDTLTLESEIFSFSYPKDYKISRIDLGDGVFQFMVINGEGSGYMIQEYTNMSPSMLNEIMLNELTKESINYGFKLERLDYVKKLNDGMEVNVDKAVLTYKDETNIYEIMSIGKKDEGIMVITMSMDANLSAEGQKLISMMWDSLTLK